MKCPNCNVAMVEKQGKHGAFLSCPNWPNCEMSVSLHSDGTPKATPADNATRLARKVLHEAFDPLWQRIRLIAWARGHKKSKLEARMQMYEWLATQMSMTMDECHIGFFNQEQCSVAMQHVQSVTDAELQKLAIPLAQSMAVASK